MFETYTPRSPVSTLEIGLVSFSSQTSGKERGLLQQHQQHKFKRLQPPTPPFLGKNDDDFSQNELDSVLYIDSFDPWGDVSSAGFASAGDDELLGLQYIDDDDLDAAPNSDNIPTEITLNFCSCSLLDPIHPSRRTKTASDNVV